MACQSLTLATSQTFGPTYFFVRLVKSLSDPLNSLRSLAVRLSAMVHESRLVKNLSDSHGSFFAGSLLIAYIMIWNWNELRAADKGQAKTGQGRFFLRPALPF